MVSSWALNGTQYALKSKITVANNIIITDLNMKSTQDTFISYCIRHRMANILGFAFPSRFRIWIFLVTMMKLWIRLFERFSYFFPFALYLVGSLYVNSFSVFSVHKYICNWYFIFTVILIHTNTWNVYTQFYGCCQ